MVDVTDDKCGIALLMTKHNVRHKLDINEVSSCMELITTEHTEVPKLIYDLVYEYKLSNSNWEEYDHDFVKKIGQKSSSLYLPTNQKAK